jgi:hypothetical protein
MYGGTPSESHKKLLAAMAEKGLGAAWILSRRIYAI